MRHLLAFVLAAVALTAAPAEAQKNCRKGIPCGNTCIAANKTCRIGRTPPPTTRTSPPAAAQQGQADTDTGAVARQAATGAWVASSRGSTYYRVGCSGAGKLSPANRIYFKTEAAAKAAGYRRSTQRGC